MGGSRGGGSPNPGWRSLTSLAWLEISPYAVLSQRRGHGGGRERESGCEGPAIQPGTVFVSHATSFSWIRPPFDAESAMRGREGGRNRCCTALVVIPRAPFFPARATVNLDGRQERCEPNRDHVVAERVWRGGRQPLLLGRSTRTFKGVRGCWCSGACPRSGDSPK